MKSSIVKKLEQIVEAGRQPVERDAIYREVIRDDSDFSKWEIGRPVEELVGQGSS